MPTPGEHKTVQARILAYAQEMGWTYVPRDEAERRRGLTEGGFPASDFGELSRVAGLPKARSNPLRKENGSVFAGLQRDMQECPLSVALTMALHPLMKAQIRVNDLDPGEVETLTTTST